VNVVLLGLALGLGAPALKDKEKPPTIVGEWEVESITTNGRQSAVGGGLRYTFTVDGKWLIHRDGIESSPTINRGFTADAKPNPPTVDLTTSRPGGPESRLIGIYKVDGDTLTICGTRAKGADRPTRFEAPTGSGITIYVLKRSKKE
jgi:uncharacterized protein (TIGR03067 family)